MGEVEAPRLQLGALTAAMGPRPLSQWLPRSTPGPQGQECSQGDSGERLGAERSVRVPSGVLGAQGRLHKRPGRASSHSHGCTPPSCSASHAAPLPLQGPSEACPCPQAQLTRLGLLSVRLTAPGFLLLLGLWGSGARDKARPGAGTVVTPPSLCFPPICPPQPLVVSGAGLGGGAGGIGCHLCELFKASSVGEHPFRLDMEDRAWTPSRHTRCPGPRGLAGRSRPCPGGGWDLTAAPPAS